MKGIVRVSKTLRSPVETLRISRAAAIPDLTACIGLQKAVWEFSPDDAVPEQVFIVADRTGGHVFLAYDRNQPIGFALAFAAFRDGRPYLHSHMVGVLKDYRDRGVGRSLKLAQRNEALARGIDLIEWTFDVLQLKNAHFNIGCLGAIVRRYIPNLYGRTTSPLHGGLPTDRLVAEWWVSSPRVKSLLEGIPSHIPATRARIAIPANILDVCRDEPRTAEGIQAQARASFEYWTERRYAVTGFELKENEGHYLLEPYED